MSSSSPTPNNNNEQQQQQHDGPSLNYIKTRMEFMRALKSTPSHPKLYELDYVQSMEVIGIWISFATIAKLSYEKKIDDYLATYLNATLALNAFIALHSATHESMSQHNEEHLAFEGLVFRMAALVANFDDGYKENHKRHHNKTNSPTEDPDYAAAFATLAELGFAFNHGNSNPLTFAPRREEMGGNWNFETSRIAAMLMTKFAISTPEYSKVGETLMKVWRQSNSITSMLLYLFFARYPHRKGYDPFTGKMRNEMDSFYENTYRGQGQVDLWMMGEGFHNAHHAKNDIPYTVLPRVGKEVEEMYPEIKQKSRGNFKILDMEKEASNEGNDVFAPELMNDGDREPMQFPYERTLKVRHGIDLLTTHQRPKEAIVTFADAVITSALHVSGTADLSMLRDLHQQMCKGVDPNTSKGVIPFHKWGETIFSDKNQQLLHKESENIKAEILKVAGQVGDKWIASNIAIKSKEDIKTNYLSFFKSIMLTFASEDDYSKFFKAFASEKANILPRADPSYNGETLMEYLNSELPNELIPPANRDLGSMDKCVQTIANMIHPYVAETKARL